MKGGVIMTKKSCSDVAEVMLSMLVHEGVLTKEELHETNDEDFEELYDLLIKRFRERKSTR